MSFFVGDELAEKGPTWAEEEVILAVVKEIVESELGERTYHRSKMITWANTIGDKCLRGLANLQKPYKYIVEVSIMQRNGAGLHYASSCLWDTSQDGTACLQWNNDTLHCIVCIFGLGI